MKRDNYLVVVMAIMAIVLLATGIYVGEAQSAEFDRIDRIEGTLDRIAEQCGYVNLGVIDAYAVSKESGYMYNGPAVRAALFERIGQESPENCWVFGLDEYDGAYLLKLVVYKDDDSKPLTQREIDKVYLYGVI